jgi:AraC-like DNA-binding protein
LFEEYVLAVPVKRLTTTRRTLDCLTARSWDGTGTVRVLHAYVREIAGLDAAHQDRGLAGIAADLLDLALAEVTGDAGPVRPEVLTRQVRQFIIDNATTPTLTPDAVAAAFHLSRRTLYALLEQETISPGELIRDARLARAVRLLEPVETISHRSGFSDPTTFRRCFKRAHAMTPAEYRRSGPQPDAAETRPP